MSVGNSLVEILTQKIVQDIEAEILKLKFGQDFEAQVVISKLVEASTLNYG